VARTEVMEKIKPIFIVRQISMNQQNVGQTTTHHRFTLFGLFLLTDCLRQSICCYHEFRAEHGYCSSSNFSSIVSHQV